MKKLLSVVLIFIILYSISGCGFSHKTEAHPTITEWEFPFYVEFIFNGEIYVYEDTVVCSFDGYDYSAMFKKPRTWSEKFKSTDKNPTNKLILKETNSELVLVKSRINDVSQLMLSCGKGDYYMGESEYKQLSKPCFYYHEEYRVNEKTELTQEQLEKYFGLKIVRFEFSDPIKNEFKYNEN